MIDKNLGGADEKRPVGRTPSYFKAGASIVLIFFACIVLFFIIYRWQSLSSAVHSLFSILQAVIFGCMLAYIMNPIMKFFDRHLQRFFGKHLKKKENVPQISRALGTAIAVLIFIGAITLLLCIIIPQVVASIQGLATTLPGDLESLLNQIEKFSRGSSQQAQLVRSIITNVGDQFDTWVNNNVLNQAQTLIETVASGVISVVKTFFNFIIGIILAVYILMKKETFICQVKKLIYAIFPPRAGNCVMDVVRKADDVFGGFFIGMIIDSIIVGFISFGLLTVFQIPYAMLVSVILACTNVIPFFGPIIGTVSGAILVCLSSPIHALYFLIIVIILLQVDGNVIQPKIVGYNIDLSPFWVVFATLLFGGVFGIPGMLFGVPTFAVIYYIIKRISEHFLRKRKLPTATDDYLDFNRVDTENGAPAFYETDRQTRHRAVGGSGGLLRKRFMKRRENNSSEDTHSEKN